MLFSRFILPGLWSQGRVWVSHVPREPHCAFALFFDPGQTFAPSLPGARVLFPSVRQRKLQQRTVISRLIHTASALAVYASCRHLWRRRKTRFRGWPAFPGGIL